jgi:hypothetical protein
MTRRIVISLLIAISVVLILLVPQKSSQFNETKVELLIKQNILNSVK